MSYAIGAGVGGIEAEAVMLGQCISMVLPQVRSCAVLLECLEQSPVSINVFLLCEQCNPSRMTEPHLTLTNGGNALGGAFVAATMVT